MTRRRFRTILALAYGLLVVALVTTITVFVINVQRHVGADYTAATSNIVRGQAEASRLRDAVQRYHDDPEPSLRERILRTLQTIESRERTTRNGFERLRLEPGTRADVSAEFDRVLALLPRLRRLTREALDDPASRDQFRELGLEVESRLAYLYSSLHRRTLAAAAAQQRLTDWLGIVVIGLGLLLLAIIAVLLWAVDKVFGQKEVLQRLTVTDVLTELPNRRGLLARLEHVLPLQRRNAQPLSLALLDFDQFKSVNDQDGHPVGDAVLRFVAGQIAGDIRESDMLARLGGEEFGLLLPATESESARQLCERIRERVEELDLPMTRHVRRLTISVGLATEIVDARTDFEGLYASADRALYRAKHEGRNRVVVCT
jgi:diguanylate cyclase (GGDEF)-like protein